MVSLEEALALHRKYIVVDAHCDTIHDVLRGRRVLGEKSNIGHLDFPRMQEGGVGAQFFAAYIEPQYKPDRGVQRAIQLVDAIWGQVQAYPDQAAVALNRGDVEAIHATGKIAVIISIEGGEAVGDHLAHLRAMYRLGVRAMSLTWNQRNLLADGSWETRTRGGLTRLGVETVQEMNRLGMIVDVSHLSDAGFWDVMEVSNAPVLATHSNARALCDVPRNLTDDQIKALAQKGGVMGINFYPGFLDASGEADVKRLVDHIDHISSLVGPEHVGLGSDFDGIEKVPGGVPDVSQMPAVTRELLERGYKEHDIAGILGGNFLRVINQVWHAPGELGWPADV